MVSRLLRLGAERLRSSGWADWITQGGRSREEHSIRYGVKGPKVIGEVFDDEVIIVNFEDGSYYALGHSGRDVWLGIERQASVAEIAADLSTRYLVRDRAEAVRAVEAILARLAEHELIAPIPPEAIETGSLASHREGSLAEQRPASDNRREFTPPTLVRYTDMHQLMLLDPIHEVDESGWPRRRKQA